LDPKEDFNFPGGRSVIEGRGSGIVLRGSRLVGERKKKTASESFFIKKGREAARRRGGNRMAEKIFLTEEEEAAFSTEGKGSHLLPILKGRGFPGRRGRSRSLNEDVAKKGKGGKTMRAPREGI